MSLGIADVTRIVHPLCHGPISRQLLLPQGKRESGDKTTPHPHIPAAPAGQAVRGTAGLEPRQELVLLYPASYNYFSSLPYFCSCYPKLLAQPCVLVTPPWTERKVKTSWPCGCSSCPSSSPSPSFPWQCCTKQSNPEGKKSLQSPVLK